MDEKAFFAALRMEFLDEAEEHIQTLERVFSQLTSPSPIEEPIAKAFRAAHSIKGSANSVGFETLGHEAHQLESLLDQVRQKTLAITPALITQLIHGTDTLQQMVSTLRKNPEASHPESPTAKASPKAEPKTTPKLPMQGILPPPTPVNQSHKTEPAKHKAVIFLIDDDPNVLEIFASFLEETGYDINTFPSAKLALEAMDNGIIPETIICDYRMPQMNGIEYIAAVKQRGHADIPIILCSGHADKSVLSQSINIGITAFLEKPIGDVQFVNLVKMAVETKHLKDMMTEIAAMSLRGFLQINRIVAACRAGDFQGLEPQLNKIDGYMTEVGRLINSVTKRNE